MPENTENKSKMWQQPPFVIAGPCSAESPEQLHATISGLKQLNKVDMIRAGIWKPRTRPGHFEGMGEKALPWIKEASQEAGIPYCTEVASTEQVEWALKHDAAALWIGARSTTNPFSVQEIANAIKGVNIPVFIKNPINPDIELWIGALERIEKATNNKIALIHRGFSFYGKSQYRNAPTWQLALEMKRRFPELPFLIDPSHICGKRNLIKDVVQKAVDLGYNGMMIEAHHNPDEALSDAEQQLTPQDLGKILEEIVWRKEVDPFADTIKEELEQYRRDIDHIDDEIVNFIKLRMDIVREIGLLKERHNLTILQTERWTQTMQKFLNKAEKMNLNKDFMQQLYDMIHLESISLQDKVMNKKQN